MVVILIVAILVLVIAIFSAAFFYLYMQVYDSRFEEIKKSNPEKSDADIWKQITKEDQTTHMNLDNGVYMGRGDFHTPFWV